MKRIPVLVRHQLADREWISIIPVLRLLEKHLVGWLKKVRFVDNTAESTDELAKRTLRPEDGV